MGFLTQAIAFDSLSGGTSGRTGFTYDQCAE